MDTGCQETLDTFACERKASVHTRLLESVELPQQSEDGYLFKHLNLIVFPDTLSEDVHVSVLHNVELRVARMCLSPDPQSSSAYVRLQSATAYSSHQT